MKQRIRNVQLWKLVRVVARIRFESRVLGVKVAEGDCMVGKVDSPVIGSTNVATEIAE